MWVRATVTGRAVCTVREFTSPRRATRAVVDAAAAVRSVRGAADGDGVSVLGAALDLREREAGNGKMFKVWSYWTQR